MPCATPWTRATPPASKRDPALFPHEKKTGLILFAGRISDPGVEATEEDGPVAPSFEGMPFHGGFGMPPFRQR